MANQKNNFWIYPLLFISGIFLLFAVFYGEKSRQESETKTFNSQNRGKLFEAYAQKLQKNNRELAEKYIDTARLLLAKDNSLESRRTTALKDKLKEKEQELALKENEIAIIEAKLAQEITKAEELDKTVIALLDSLDAHKSSKELGQEKLREALNEERNRAADAKRELDELLAKVQSDFTKEKEQKDEALLALGGANAAFANRMILHDQLLALQNDLEEERHLALEQGRLERFHKILADLHQAHDSEKHEIAQVLEGKQSENEGLSIQLRIFEKELDETRALNQSLEQKLESSVTSLNKMSEDISHLSNQSTELEKKLQKEGLSKEELMDKLHEAAQKISTLENNLEVKSNQEALLAENVDKIASLEEEKNELALAISSLKGREKELLEELQNETKTAKTIRGELLKLTEGEEDIEEAFIQLTAAKERSEKLSEKLNHILSESKRYEDEKKMLAENQVNLKKELSSRDEQQALLEEKVKALSAVVGALRSEIEEKRATLSQSEQQKSFAEFSLKQKIRELERAIEALQATQK